MNGIEKGSDGTFGYGRRIIRADLRKPMVGLCPLRVGDDGMGAVEKKTKTVRLWEVWPLFDVGICKFENEQCLAAIDVEMRKT